MPANNRQSKATKIEDIVKDPRLQMRETLTDDAVAEYAAAYLAEEQLPSVEVFDVGGRMMLVDGYHRHEAALIAGVSFLRAVCVGKGDMDTAIWHASAVNPSHGVRRSAADKRRAVRATMNCGYGTDMSNRDVAAHCAVSDPFVAKVRAEWEAEQKRNDDSGANVSTCAPKSAESLERNPVVKPGAAISANRRAPWDDEPEEQKLNDDSGANVSTCAPKSPESLERKSKRKGRDGKWYPAPGELPHEAPPETATPMPAWGGVLTSLAQRVREIRLVAGRKMPKDLHQSQQRIAHLLKQAETRLLGDVPATCPKCGGEGCKYCSQRGWMLSDQADRMIEGAEA